MGSHEFTEVCFENSINILQLLEGRLPRAAMIYNVVKLHMAHSQAKNSVLSFRLEAYDGDVNSDVSFIMVTINVMGLPQNLILLSQPLFPTHEMLAALTQRINWSQPIQFEGIENSIISTLVQFGKQHGKLEEHDPIELYYLPTPETLQLPQHSNGEIVKQLSIDDALKIDSRWAAACDGSLDMLRASIGFVGSAGVYLKDTDGNSELVSWAVALPFGSIHALHTESKYQRKGYARLTMTAVSQCVWKQNRIPIVQIYKSNDTSKSVNKKVGYVYSHDINLLHYYPVPRLM